ISQKMQVPSVVSRPSPLISSANEPATKASISTAQGIQPPIKSDTHPSKIRKLDEPNCQTANAPWSFADSPRDRSTCRADGPPPPTSLSALFNLSLRRIPTKPHPLQDKFLGLGDRSL